MSQPGCAKLQGTDGPGLKIKCVTLGAWKKKGVKHRTPTKQALCAFEPQAKAMWGKLLKADKLFTCIFKSNLNWARLQQKLAHTVEFKLNPNSDLGLPHAH